MVDRPNCREDALDIVWACIRDDNERWKRIVGKYQGCTVRDVARELGWKPTTTRNLIDELCKRGQLIKHWNHQHQSYWSAHYQTLNEFEVTE